MGRMLSVGLVGVPTVALLIAVIAWSLDPRLALLGVAFVFGWSQLPGL